MEQSHTLTSALGVPLKSRLFERMRTLHQVWLKNAQEIRQLEVDYGAKLMSAATASAAASFWNEWMARRMALVLRGQEMFANSWAGSLADISESLSSASLPRPANESAGLVRP